MVKPVSSNADKQKVALLLIFSYLALQLPIEYVTCVVETDESYTNHLHPVLLSTPTEHAKIYFGLNPQSILLEEPLYSVLDHLS